MYDHERNCKARAEPPDFDAEHPRRVAAAPVPRGSEVTCYSVGKIPIAIFFKDGFAWVCLGLWMVGHS